MSSVRLGTRADSRMQSRRDRHRGRSGRSLARRTARKTKPLRFSMRGKVVAIDVARRAGGGSATTCALLLARFLLALWLLLALLLAAQGLGLGREGCQSEGGKQGGVRRPRQDRHVWRPASRS